MSLVCVIVPIYKTERYLNKCIESLINQTFDNYDIILVDDGSPDSCPMICDFYAANYKNIHVIHKENGGVSSARNAGLDFIFDKINDCKYIAFVDGDDYVDPKFLEILCSNIKGCEISVCNYYLVYGEDVKENSFCYDDIITDPLNYWSNLDGIGSSVFWNKLFDKMLFNQTRFPNVNIYEDSCLNYIIIDKSKSISLTNKKLYFYVQRTDSIISLANISKPFSNEIVLFNMYLQRISYFINKNPNFVREDFVKVFKQFKKMYILNKKETRPFFSIFRDLIRKNKYLLDYAFRLKTSIFLNFPSLYILFSRGFSRIR